MKKMILALLVLSTITSCNESSDNNKTNTKPVENTAQGNESGGGGSILHMTFRKRAEELIHIISKTPNADSLCSSQVMKNSLSASTISEVAQLTDFNSGTPLTDVSLVAWSKPGAIQLKAGEWLSSTPNQKKILDYISDEMLDTPWPARHTEVVILLHEIYRTTPSCNDDHYQISTQVENLIRDSEEFPYRHGNCNAQKLAEIHQVETSPYWQQQMQTLVQLLSGKKMRSCSDVPYMEDKMVILVDDLEYFAGKSLIGGNLWPVYSTYPISAPGVYFKNSGIMQINTSTEVLKGIDINCEPKKVIANLISIIDDVLSLECGDNTDAFATPAAQQARLLKEQQILDDEP